MSAPLLTARQLADRWQLCPETVLRYKRRRQLPFVTLPSGAIRFRADDIERIELGGQADPAATVLAAIGDEGGNDAG